jgi:hypothetical protein
MVLFKDFLEGFQKARGWKKRFLMVAQRWDTDVTELIDFTDKDWAKNLHHLALTSGELQIPAYVDFFLFPKGLYDSVPPLVIGYSYWDHWMVWRALSAGCPVVDASPFIVPVHQNHAYNTAPERTKGSLTDATAMRNFGLGGNGKHLRTILDSTHRITRSGQVRRTPLRRLFASPTVLYLRQTIAEKTFRLRDRFGLRRKKTQRPLRDTAV